MRILWAFLVACSTTVTLAALWAHAFNGLGAWGARYSTLIGILLAIAAFYTCRSSESTSTDTPYKKYSQWEGLLFLTFAIASFRCFFWLIYPDRNSLCVLSRYNLGDIALHIQLIQYFALGTPFWPESPILSGGQLVYPAGMDLLNAIIVLLGGNLLQSLVWVGGVGAALTALALWRWGGGFALAAFLFAGGGAGLNYLTGGRFDFSQEHIEWKNLFLSMFVTQRGLLYALPAGLALLYEWKRELLRTKAIPPLTPFEIGSNNSGGSGSGVPFGWQALLYATMPLFSIHTFLFLSLTLACCFLFSGKPKIQKYTLNLVLISFVPATVCIWLVSGGFHGDTNFRFLPGWLQDEHPWQFWWKNFGILPLLWLSLLFIPAMYRSAGTRCFFFAGSIAFLCCCFFSITPWAWDNTKLMLWGYLAVVPFLWSELLKHLPPLLKYSLCLLLFFSGAVALFGGLRSPGYPLIALPELRDVEASLKLTPSLSRFATAPDYNHPIALNGRKRVAGYEGHLWSHGLPYQPVLEKLDRLMNGTHNWKSLARELHADFLFWGPREEKRYPYSKQPWRIQTPLVKGAYGTIYDLR